MSLKTKLVAAACGAALSLIAGTGIASAEPEAGPAAPGNIRKRVDRDAALAATDRSFTDTLMFWRTPPKPGVVVDPTREAQRIRTNAALGQSQEQGETPIIERKQKSLWDSIL